MPVSKLRNYCPKCGKRIESAAATRCPACKQPLTAPLVEATARARSSAPTATSSARPTDPGVPTQPVKPIRRASRRVIGTLVTVMAIGLTWMVSVEFRRWIASANWPSTNATILQSDVSEAVAKSSTSKRSVFRPAIHYRYEVDGRELEGHRVYFGSDATSSDDVSAWMSQRAAERIARKYPKDATANVYYDPQNPEFAILQRTMDVAAWGMFGLSLFILYIGVRLITSALLSDDATARSRLWLFKREMRVGDGVAGGIPLALFAICQFVPDLFR